MGIVFLLFGVGVFLVTKRPMALFLNLILAAVMGALILWSKRAPATRFDEQWREIKRLTLPFL